MDRPIIFSAPMVRALLDGRKTQTRRVLNPQPAGWAEGCYHRPDGRWIWVTGPRPDNGPGPGVMLSEESFRIPYAAGDRLYVREAFSYETLDVDRNGFMPPWYWADGNPASGDFTRPKPSIHMPRWASRITLTVTEVRVQRLQEISEEDAGAEGIFHRPSDFYPQGVWTHGGDEGWHTPEAAYRHLWNSLHGPDAWDENPWVVAITFTTERRNIDAI